MGHPKVSCCWIETCLISDRFQHKTGITITLAISFNFCVIAGNCFSTSVTVNCWNKCTTANRATIVLFVWWSIQPVAIGVVFWTIKEFAAVQTDILVQREITFQTAVLRPVIALGRRPTTSTIALSFSSVRRGRTKFISM